MSGCEEFVIAAESTGRRFWRVHARISHIHLKDAKGQEWKPIGVGELDFAGQFQAVKRMKYAGTLSVETHYKNARQDLYASSVESMNGLMSVLKKI